LPSSGSKYVAKTWVVVEEVDVSRESVWVETVVVLVVALMQVLHSIGQISRLFMLKSPLQCCP
jgi:hypothetical protein